MRSHEELVALLPFLLLFLAIFAFSTYPMLSFVGAQSTGVCIYKGQSFTGFLSSSPGIPLRGIGVTAWHPGGFGGQIIDHIGSTDRMGCFIFKTSTKETLSYTYNGTGYIDQVDPGVVLQDNVP